ncbi:MAG TPA: TlpA disulfide reductase family protein [Sphingobacteriaceae bacterium]
MRKIFRTTTVLFLGLAVLLLIGINSKARALVVRALIRVGVYEPNVSGLKPKAAAITPNEPNAMKPMPDLLFRDADGKAVSITELRGKVIFLNFWATWCPPCIAEMPSINTLYNNVKSNGNIVFLMVDVDGNAGRSKKIMQKKQFNLPVHVPESSIPETIFRGTIPTTLIINKEGFIVFHEQSMADYSADHVKEFMLQLAGQ